MLTYTYLTPNYYTDNEIKMSMENVHSNAVETILFLYN